MEEEELEYDENTYNLEKKINKKLLYIIFKELCFKEI